MITLPKVPTGPRSGAPVSRSPCRRSGGSRGERSSGPGRSPPLIRRFLGTLWPALLLASAGLALLLAVGPDANALPVQLGILVTANCSAWNCPGTVKDLAATSDLFATR